MLDCQDTSIHARRYGGVLAYIASEVGRSVGVRVDKLDFGDDPSVVSDKFKENMLRYLSQGRQNILIIFDEIENISPRTASSPHWKEESDALFLWQILRSFFQTEKKYGVSFCFVGTNPGLLEQSQINGIPNPIYLFAKKTFIPSLDHADTENMVKRLGYFMGIDFPKSVVSHLQHRYGGHPFFIRQICSKIHYQLPMRRPVVASVQSCKEAEKYSYGDIHRYVNDILGSLKQFYPEEYEMLSYISSGKEEEFYEVANEFPEFVEHLLGYGLLVKRGDHFDFEFDFVREVLISEQKKSVPDELNAIRVEISRRRNAIEEAIRVYLYWATCGLDEQSWKSMIFNTIKLDRIPLFPNCRVAFSKNESKLYIVEIIKILKYLNVNIPGFNIEEIVGALHYINTKRVDAHAGIISVEDYKELANRFDLIDSAFLPPD